MNLWMNDERKTIARQYVHDMVRSFVTEREAEGGLRSNSGGALTMTSIYAPDIERLLEIACDCDNYATKHKELNPFYTNDYYDIDGHCVHSLNGTVTIIFNGVSIQQKEYAEQMKLIEQYREERRKGTKGHQGVSEEARRQRHADSTKVN